MKASIEDHRYEASWRKDFNAEDPKVQKLNDEANRLESNLEHLQWWVAPLRGAPEEANNVQKAMMEIVKQFKEGTLERAEEDGLLDTGVAFLSRELADPFAGEAGEAAAA